MTVQIRVLGPLDVEYAGAVVPVPGRKQRTALAALASAGVGRVVSVDVLIDTVWGDLVPHGAEHSLQQHVSTLRRLVADLGHPDAASVIVRRDPGYCLGDVVVDSERFEADAGEGFAAAARLDWDAALERFDTALEAWRGDAFADAREAPRLNSAAVRLDSLRLTVEEARFDAILATGRAGDVVARLEAAVKAHPLHEPFWKQLMMALYRAGRQAEALAAFRSARSTLVEQLGIEPRAELRELEQAILIQDPALDPPAPALQGGLLATFRVGQGPMTTWVELPDGQAVLLVAAVNLVGRDPTAAIRLADSRVSRRHAVIESSASWVVRDLGSTNGTAVNGRRVDEAATLTDGDEIDVGGIKLRFRHAQA